MYRVKYEGYLFAKLTTLKNLRRLRIIIPHSFNFPEIPGFRNESAEKLTSINPDTLGQASRIAGVNPSDIDVLNGYDSKASISEK